MFSIKNWGANGRWQNWSGSYTAQPSEFLAPQTPEQISNIVERACKSGKTIRVTGAAHSFSPLAMPEQIALSLHHMRGLIDVDVDKMEATFYAGTYLYEIGPLLAQHGLALYNMGDIDVQSLAGVVATGTHGTGSTLGSFSDTVVKWGWIDGQGRYVEHVRAEDELSEALHLSLGLLGIFVTLTIKVRPLYSLHYVSERVALEPMLNNFFDTIQAHRHVEWYYFPGSTTLQQKTMNEIALTEQSKWQAAKQYAQLQIVENGLLQVASTLCKMRPALSPAISKLSAELITTGEKTGLCFEIFPSPRHVKFHEVEYAIPLEHFPSCLRAVHELFLRERLAVHFPIECRVAAPENGFLSPSQGKEVAYIAFHQYAGRDPTAYFRVIDQLMQQFDGRAHWGKYNRYSTQSVAQLYPKLAAFEAVRAQFDRADTFMTTSIRKIFDKNDNS